MLAETQIEIQTTAMLVETPTEMTTHNEKVPFTHDHFDENWYVILAELHVQEQCKKDKWFG